MIDEEIKKIEQDSYENYAKELEKLRAEHRHRENEMNSHVEKLDTEIKEKELRISTMNLSATKGKGKEDNRKNNAVDNFVQEMKEKERENQELRKEIEAIKESHRKVATVETKGGCLKSCVVF